MLNKIKKLFKKKEPVLMPPVFYFKTDASLGICIDNKTREGAEAYVSIGIGNTLMPPSTYYQLINTARAILANQLGVDANLIYPITKSEYDENMEEE
jgi:hypothetical protein